ncbi:type IV pilus secretin PilQ family protein [Aestuariibacter sp. AA17]|uniref:Type IV pilus secretin PilQ family protein n=1 Tax=Fluctibacter corallii TaxID=2984329 RepID=A0ABT3A7W9_9ALTE|nr:type IV pilus secretin PilQ family protein [Aestuariibacter sp. AA17]MCV2884377.1 type IV pilus secretin PilQ family protein [Aestuariibacter sp. AA17]
MSERYIFNKKLNRTNRVWYLLGMLAIAVFGHESMAQSKVDLSNAPMHMADLQNGSVLENIDFTRTENEAQVQFLFSNEKYQLHVENKDAIIEIILPNVKLGEDQLVELDVTEFGTMVKTIESFAENNRSRIVIEVNQPSIVSHARNNEHLVVSLSEKPATSEENAENQAKEYEGKPISLDFQDVPVRQVLQIIAQVNGFNLVTTDTVSGNVTISLTDVPWDQALDMILRIKGLDKRVEGNILLIAPSEELTARETQTLQSQKQVADLAPLLSQSIQINYAKAAEMANILKNGDASILTTRGTVTVDERTNTLLVKDTYESIEEARKVITELDIPIRQVLIESRMVTVRDNYGEQLGVRWGFSDQQDTDGISGSLEGANTIASGNIPVINDRLNVNLPVTNPAGSIGIQIARLVDGTILDLELSALETENKGEIIASPRITVANQREAYIEQGTEIPYVQATSSGATSVEFKKAVLSLKVTPHITPDNRIILDLVVTQDTRGETVSTSTGPAVAIDTQEISTQVLVENGETIVLGGIFQQTSTDDVNKVPLLGDLPILGRMFKKSQEVSEKRELLIFVTPKVLTEAL